MRFFIWLIFGIVLTGCTHLSGHGRKVASDHARPAEVIKFVDSENWNKWGLDFQQEADQFNQQLMELVEKLRVLGGEGKLLGQYNGQVYYYYNEQEGYQPAPNKRCKMTVETRRGGSIEVHRIELIFENRKTGQLQITTIMDPTRQKNLPQVTLHDFDYSSSFAIQGSLALSQNPIVDFELEKKLLIQEREAKHPLFELNLIDGMPTDVRMSDKFGTKKSDSPAFEKCVFDVLS